LIEARDGRRVVITGVGVLAPCGIGVDEFWAGLSKPAKPETNRRVESFDPVEWGLKHVEVRRIERFAQLAIAAADLARRDAGIDQDSPYAPSRSGVMLGTGIGGAYAWEINADVLMDKGAKYVSPLVVPMVMPNAAAAHVSIRSGFTGPVETITTACAAGTHAVGHGARLIASGRADVVLTGGSESSQTPVLNNGFLNMKALSPTGISRPFDRARDGFCSAEAAAVLVLEEYEAAKARGATIYAEIAGTASTADAHHITAPAPNGAGAIACMRAALDDAGVPADAVTHVNAHGTSTQLNDAAEAIAVGCGIELVRLRRAQRHAGVPPDLIRVASDWRVTPSALRGPPARRELGRPAQPCLRRWEAWLGPSCRRLRRPVHRHQANAEYLAGQCLR